MKKYLFIFIAFFSLTTHAQDCDCTKQVGACSATYQVTNIKNDPQRINSSADLKLTSSAPSCSKITFLVDSTPYISILKSTSSANESIFGTSHIDDRTVSIDSCRVCTRSNAPQPPSSDSAATAYFLNPDSPLYSEKPSSSLEEESNPSGFIEVLGAIQGVMQHHRAIQGKATTNSNGTSACSTLGGCKGLQLPSHCRSNPRASGCPYATNPNGYDPTPQRK